MQTGAGDFPWCVRTGTAVQDGFAAVKLAPIRGEGDRAGGAIWSPGAQRPRGMAARGDCQALLDLDFRLIESAA